MKYLLVVWAWDHLGKWFLGRPLLIIIGRFVTTLSRRISSFASSWYGTTTKGHLGEDFSRKEKLSTLIKDSYISQGF